MWRLSAFVVKPFSLNHKYMHIDRSSEVHQLHNMASESTIKDNKSLITKMQDRQVTWHYKLFLRESNAQRNQ